MATRDHYEPLDTDETDFDDEDVAIMKDDEGRATLVPRSLSRLSAEARSQTREIREVAEQIHGLQAKLDALILEGRDEFGLSWNAIGWSIGTSGQNAHRRWSTVETSGD